jgi:hypothetical protein
MSVLLVEAIDVPSILGDFGHRGSPLHEKLPQALGVGDILRKFEAETDNSDRLDALAFTRRGRRKALTLGLDLHVDGRVDIRVSG